jgi:hypothetical protein
LESENRRSSTSNQRSLLCDPSFPVTRREGRFVLR